MATSIALLALSINAAVIYSVLRKLQKRFDHLQLKLDLFEQHQITVNKSAAETHLRLSAVLTEIFSDHQTNVLKLPVIKKGPDANGRNL